MRILILSMLLVGSFLSAIPEEEEDFTDSGVGCVNDCLDEAPENERG